MSAREGLAAVLAAHEARWTTHGWERTYQVMHCAGDCDWSLRQKVRMSDDDCYDRHRAHLADVILRDWLPGALADERVVEAAARSAREGALIAPLGPNARAVHDMGAPVSLTPDEAEAAATAALTAAVTALREETA